MGYSEVPLSTYHQFIGYLSSHHTEGQNVYGSVLREYILRRLLGNHQSRQHHQSQRYAWGQYAGSLYIVKFDVKMKYTYIS